MKKLIFITSFLIALIVSLPMTLAATQNLIYDANGNLVTGDGKYRIYDGFNHLVQIKNGNDATGTILENITWHPLEERTLVKATYETNGSWKETVYYISKSFVRVKNSSGTFDYKYIYQNGQLVAQELVGGQKNFMLNDHKGTAQVVVNESGAKVEENFYSPFGEIISGGTTSRFDYEGKEYDSVVGDYDYNARKVLTIPPIFAQPDTMLPNVYDPQQLNRYTFERNNPVNFKDEDGNAAFWIHGKDTFLTYYSSGFSFKEAGIIAAGAMEPDLYRASQAGGMFGLLAERAAARLGLDLKMEHSDNPESYYHEESKYNLEADYWSAINSGDLEKAGNIEHALGHDVGSGGIPGYHSNAAFQNQFNFKFGSLDIKPVHWANDVISIFTDRNALNKEQANRAKSAYQQSSGGGGSSGSWYAYRESSNTDSTTYSAIKSSGNGYTWTSVTVSSPKKK